MLPLSFLSNCYKLIVYQHLQLFTVVVHSWPGGGGWGYSLINETFSMLLISEVELGKSLILV